jgi:hypothetical protein
MASTSSIPLSERAAKHVGGVRRRDETPQQFRDRMDTKALQTGQMPRGVPMPMAQPPGGQTRQDRIIAARMDGTFDQKVADYNAGHAAAGTGKQLDAAGNPVAAVNPVTPPNVTPPVTASLPVTAPSRQAITPASSGPLMRPVGKINGQPASLVLEGLKPPPPAAVSPLSPQEEKQFTALGKAIQISRQPMPGKIAPTQPAKRTPIRFTEARPMSPGSVQFQQEFKNLRAGQSMTKAPGVPAVIPRPGSKSPQPFSSAALGTSKPRAVMPTPLAMLGR